MQQTRTWAQAITVGDALLRTAAERPQTTALVTPAGRWTYAQVAERASVVARGLIALGVEPGDHVGMLLPNSFECLTTLFGVALAAPPLSRSTRATGRSSWPRSRARPIWQRS